jgi:hypothetical protein
MIMRGRELVAAFSAQVGFRKDANVETLIRRLGWVRVLGGVQPGLPKTGVGLAVVGIPSPSLTMRPGGGGATRGERMAAPRKQSVGGATRKKKKIDRQPASAGTAAIMILLRKLDQ